MLRASLAIPAVRTCFSQLSRRDRPRTSPPARQRATVVPTARSVRLITTVVGRRYFVFYTQSFPTPRA